MAAYGWTIALILLAGMALTLAFFASSDVRIPLWRYLLVGLTGIGAPFVAGWMSPRLGVVVLIPFIMLAGTYVGYTNSDFYPGDVFEREVYMFIQAFMLGGMTSAIFTAGWGVRLAMKRAVRRPVREDTRVRLDKRSLFTLVRVGMAAHRWTIFLFLLTGVTLSAWLFIVAASDPNPLFLISTTVVGIGAPCIAGWLSPKLSHVAFLPFVLLVSMWVAYRVYIFSTGDTNLVPSFVPAFVLAGFACSAFAAGWGARWTVRKADSRLRR